MAQTAHKIQPLKQDVDMLRQLMGISQKDSYLFFRTTNQIDSNVIYRKMIIDEANKKKNGKHGKQQIEGYTFYDQDVYTAQQNQYIDDMPSNDEQKNDDNMNEQDNDNERSNETIQELHEQIIQANNNTIRDTPETNINITENIMDNTTLNTIHQQIMQSNNIQQQQHRTNANTTPARHPAPSLRIFSIPISLPFLFTWLRLLSSN